MGEGHVVIQGVLKLKAWLLCLHPLHPGLTHMTSLTIHVVPYDLVLSSLGRIYAFDNEMSNENVSGHQFTIQTLRNKHV